MSSSEHRSERRLELSTGERAEHQAERPIDHRTEHRAGHQGDHRAELIPLTQIPLIEQPTSLPELLIKALRAQRLSLASGDILVLAHKLVAKAEGRTARLSEIEPSEDAQRLAATTGKDPRLVELILRESHRVVRARPGLIITEHRLGLVSANAGIDLSNAGLGEQAILLPADPDESARLVRAALAEYFGCHVGVIVADTQGRPFRLGAVGVAIGVAGVRALVDWRGVSDLYGRKLESSEEAVADELAAAATLLMGQAQEGIPAVLARGFHLPRHSGAASDLIRPKEADLFR